MAEQPLNRVLIKEWPGLMSGIAHHRIGSGARTQDNCASSTPGQLTARRGYVPIDFADGGTEDTADAIYLAGLQRADKCWLVYLTNTGELRTGHSPTIQ
jgi:hypothetical protein